MDKEIHSIITEYRRKLETSGIKVKKIILYGSYASGGAREDSDIDLVVVSHDFKKVDFCERFFFPSTSLEKVSEYFIATEPRTAIIRT